MKPKRLLTTLAILIVILIAGCKEDDFVEVEGVCPLVVSTFPIDGATNVPLNTIITATFNESMNPLTITQATFTVQSPTKSSYADIIGTVTYDDATKTASFTPSGLLLTNTTYTCRIGEAIKDVNGNALQTDYVWTFSTGLFLAPTVISTSPANNEIDVAFDKTVTATFSVPMNPATITASTFTLYNGLVQVTGVVTYSGSIASLNPAVDLLPGITYTATITNAVENVAGTALASNYIWTFTVGSLAAPTIILTDPQHNDINVAINKTVTAKFSEPMNSSTINGTSFSLYEGLNPVAGTIFYLDSVASFNPDVDLLPGTTYTVTVGIGVENVAGTALENDSVWQFTTIAAIPPTVISTDPADLEANVLLNKVISATFSTAMDPLTITDLTFTVETSGGVALTGTVALDVSGLVATFTPDVNLLSDSTYIATITTGVENLSGTALVADYVWEFYTGAHLGPLAPDLLSVARFGIIAGVGVTNAAGASVINDLDVGIYPGVRSSITGFFVVDGGPGIINNGDFYAADDAGAAAMLIQAKADLVAVYLEAEGATSPAPATVAGDLGGQTLAPGIYKSTSTLLIQSGNLTLDAQGDANAVWIFQIASDFTTVGGSPFPSPAGGNVILSGGAQAKNVYWQVGISAVIGDYTSFKGNVLALTSITMNAYSVAEGRMLCQNGAIVLTSTNIINKP